ncbi:MAG: NACHT domain-containing protein, partial [Spirulina sp. SIO3F2]|nr:NACHT domain-containing protein [Spirulina sp. SIO3F2]
RAQDLPLGTQVIDCFEDLGVGRSLLILGAPGSGKTTTLLALAKELIEQAHMDASRLIPVVFNLSSWADEQQTIADWLVQELQLKYQVGKEIGRKLVTEQQLVLLLDGLDEVDIQRRDCCVQALNDFMQTYGQTELVVCSRQQDYDALSQRLQLQGAISIQPLTGEQIDAYLAGAGAELQALRGAIAQDTKLQMMAHSPLMLSIMALAYQGVSTEAISQTGDVESFRQRLFETYIQRAFERRVGKAPKYTPAQTQKWLRWLAQQQVKQSQTVFLIENLQPDHLLKKQQKWRYLIAVGLIVSLTISLFGGWAGWLLVGLNVQAFNLLTASVALGLGCGLLAGAVSQHIEPVETLKWSWQKAKENLWISLGFGVVSALTVAFSIQLYMWGLGFEFMPLSMFWYGVRGLNLGVVFLLLRGLSGSSIETRTEPNQAIWRSLRTAILFGFLGTVCLGMAAHWFKLAGIGALLGFLLGPFSPAGLACIQHFILRLILYANGNIPWNYTRFLDWATDLILLQKVGGGYIFMHRLLLEYFAETPTPRMKPHSQGG